MKSTFIVLGLGLSSLVFAHGPKAEQASEAVKAATQLFLKKNASETTKQFQSVSAVFTGHERLTVVIGTANNTKKFSYDCSENEMVEPVEWECTVLGD